MKSCVSEPNNKFIVSAGWMRKHCDCLRWNNVLLEINDDEDGSSHTVSEGSSTR